MKNKLLALVCTTLIATTSLTGCQSTTDGGATGSKRSQLLLIPSAELNAEVAVEYKKFISQARAARALDVPATYASRVKTIFNRLVPHTAQFRPDGTKFDWEIHTVNSDEINAWCMPGGKMVVYSGIIKELNLTNDELAAIIGHEMAHALREHTREKISQEYAKKQGLSILGKVAGLDASQMKIAELVGQYGFSLPFSRQMESESDVIGLELMARAGYNPEAAVTLWEKMGQKSGTSAFESLTSTHPTSGARVNEIKSRLPQVTPLYEAARKGGKKK
jgi:predicted Zn-dependent protease